MTEIPGQLDLFDLLAAVEASTPPEAAEDPVARRIALLAERWNTDPLHRVLRENEWVCGRCGELA
ncbi:MAG: hypothetical protein QM658_17810, partial [Gordonia sp. (in: high G+C Gram-positive bacteria)]